MTSTKLSTPCNAIILSAGQSSRMKREKALLAFDEKHTFIEKIISTYTKVCNELVLIVHKSLSQHLLQTGIAKDVKIIVNDKIKLGRNYSILLGLNSINIEHPTFIQNIDNPFTDKHLLLSLLENIAFYDYCFPVSQGKGGHPVLLSSRLQKSFVSDYSDDLHFRHFLESYSKYELHVNTAKYSANINTAAAYNQIFEKNRT